jgi:NitT/TauT family transport system permease protein
MTDVNITQAAIGMAPAPKKSASQHKSLRRALLVNTLRVLVFIVFILVWQFVVSPAIDPFYVSSPTRIAVRLFEWVTDGVLLPDLLYTMQSTFMGYAVGSAAGVACGFLLGRIKLLGEVMDPFLDGLNSLPRVALGPLFTLWLGIDLAPKILMVASLVFFVVLSNTRAGVRDVNPDFINVLRIMGADERTILRKVVLPSAAVWIYAGLQIALPWALIGAVIGEMIASDRGMGYQILHSGGILDSTGIFAGLVVLMIAGLALTNFIRLLEKHSQKWRPQAS